MGDFGQAGSNSARTRGGSIGRLVVAFAAVALLTLTAAPPASARPSVTVARERGPAGYYTDIYVREACPAAAPGNFRWLVAEVDGQLQIGNNIDFQTGTSDFPVPPGMIITVTPGTTQGRHIVELTCREVAGGGGDVAAAPITRTFAPIVLRVSGTTAAPTAATSVTADGQLNVSAACERPHRAQSSAVAYLQYGSDTVFDAEAPRAQSAQSSIPANGQWTTTLTVPSDAPTGPSQLFVACTVGDFGGRWITQSIPLAVTIS